MCVSVLVSVSMYTWKPENSLRHQSLGTNHLEFFFVVVVHLFLLF